MSKKSKTTPKHIKSISKKTHKTLKSDIGFYIFILCLIVGMFFAGIEVEKTRQTEQNEYVEIEDMNQIIDYMYPWGVFDEVTVRNNGFLNSYHYIIIQHSNSTYNPDSTNETKYLFKLTENLRIHEVEIIE